MSASHLRTSRRAFFTKGSAVIGAGVALTGTVLADDSVATDHNAADREAIRQVQAVFAASVETRQWENAVALFAPKAHLQLATNAAQGVPAIRQLFTQQYAGQKVDSLHNAYRPNALQLQDRVSVATDGLHAQATWHVDVQVISPLRGDCTIAQMARMQGQMGDMRWESGLLEASYVRRDGRWLMDGLAYRVS